MALTTLDRLPISESLYGKEIGLLHWLSHGILGGILYYSSLVCTPNNFPLSRLSFIFTILFSLISYLFFLIILSYIERRGRLVLWLWDLGLYLHFNFFFFTLLNSLDNRAHKNFWIPELVTPIFCLKLSGLCYPSREVILPNIKPNSVWLTFWNVAKRLPELSDLVCYEVNSGGIFRYDNKPNRPLHSPIFFIWFHFIVEYEAGVKVCIFRKCDSGTFSSRWTFSKELTPCEVHRFAQ